MYFHTWQHPMKKNSQARFKVGNIGTTFMALSYHWIINTYLWKNVKFQLPSVSFHIAVCTHISSDKWTLCRSDQQNIISSQHWDFPLCLWIVQQNHSTPSFLRCITHKQTVVIIKCLCTMTIMKISDMISYGKFNNWLALLIYEAPVITELRDWWQSHRLRSSSDRVSKSLSMPSER